MTRVRHIPRLGLRLTSMVLIVSLTSCGWKITPPPGEALSAITRPIAESVVLEVNDGSVIWGRGELGQTAKQTLLEKGGFRVVHYPIEPRNPPANRLQIQANGLIEEEVGLGIVKSIIIGALFFIPVGIIRFHRDFVLDATVSYRVNGKEIRRFPIHSQTEVSHTMFSQTDEYEPVARKVAFSRLAEDIIRELSAKP